MEFPPYVAVGPAFRTWEKLGAAPWLVRQLRFGIQLPWTQFPSHLPLRPYPLRPKEEIFAKEEVRRWEGLEFARKATRAELEEIRSIGCVSPAFVTNMDTKSRLVVDYSRVNECLEDRSFRMDQLGDFAPHLNPGDSLFKADISDAYYYLRLRPEDHMRLAFAVGEIMFIPHCLNCGLKVAPWFFTKAMRPVVGHLRTRGHRIFSYRDDFFGAAAAGTPDGISGHAETVALRDEMATLFASLGLRLHPNKCNFTGTTCLEILGIVVDTKAQMFLLSPKKLARVEISARRLLAQASRRRRAVSKTAIKSFAGLANSAAPAVVDARLRLRALFDSLSLRHGMSTKPLRHPRLSHAAMRDLRWWARLSENPHVGPEMWGRPTATVFTDASLRGWGAVWNGKVPHSGFFTEAHEGASINELEVLAALYGIRSFLREARRQHVLLTSDSLATVHVVRNMTSTFPRILARLRELRKLCELHGVTLSTRHLPSVLNVWADRLSRRRDSFAWDLPRDAQILLTRRFGRLAVMDGCGLPGPTRPTYGATPVVIPRPALTGVWARNLAQRREGILIAPR